jgi:hypothetical protein
MNEKRLTSRVIPKHGIEAAWSLAKTFVPKQGEFIIYDKDENYAYERFKIGDGVTAVNDLPFTLDIAIADIEAANKDYVDTNFATKEDLNNIELTPGADGISATHSWNGTTLTVTSASGTSSADLKGDAGYTPVRGTDFWTEADKEEMKSYIRSYIEEILLGGKW